MAQRKAELAEVNEDLNDKPVDKNSICAEIQQERALKEALERKTAFLPKNWLYLRKFLRISNFQNQASLKLLVL